MTAPPKVRRVDYFPDEFLSGVSNLKHDEIGPYWVACSLMYSRGGPIDDDDAWIAKAAGCHVKTWRKIKARLLTIGKLGLTPDGKLTNARTMRELERTHGRISDAHKAAAASVESRRKSRAKPDSKSTETGVKPESNPSQTGATRVSNGDNDAKKNDDRAEINDLDQADASPSAQANQQPATNNQQPAIRERGAPRARRSRTTRKGTPFPDGWQLSAEDREKATTRDLDPDQTFEHFRAYHQAKETEFANWSQAWLAWCIKAQQFGQTRDGRKSRSATAAEGLDLALARRVERARTDDDDDKGEHKPSKRIGF